MCRFRLEKGTVFVNQNAAGSNQAQVEEIQMRLSTISIVLLVICVLLGIAALYFIYKQYKKCHKNWISHQIIQNNLRRSFTRARDNREEEREVRISASQ